MKIAGYDYLADQNNRIRNQLQDFSSTTKAAETVVPVDPSSTSPSDKSTDKQTEKDNSGVTLSISANGNAMSRLSNRVSDVSSSFAPTDFSSKAAEETAETTPDAQATENSGNAVLNQYRFFVQSTQYEGDDGVVKRIFR